MVLNLLSLLEIWCAWQESNLRPADSKSHKRPATVNEMFLKVAEISRFRQYSRLY